MQMTPFLHVAASSSLLNQLQSLDHSLEDAVVSLRTSLLSLLTPTAEETPKPAPLLTPLPASALTVPAFVESLELRRCELEETMNEMEVEAEDTHRLLEAEKARVASLETQLRKAKEQLETAVASSRQGLDLRCFRPAEGMAVEEATPASASQEVGSLQQQVSSLQNVGDEVSCERRSCSRCSGVRRRSTAAWQPSRSCTTRRCLRESSTRLQRRPSPA